MIQQPTNYLPVQQAAVQQQIQQGQVPMQQPMSPIAPMPRSEYNAIKIDIKGATVGTPQEQMGINIPQPALYPEAPGQKLNYIA